MIKFDNPPDYVAIDSVPTPSNKLPVLHGFNAVTGNYWRADREIAGLLIIQPLFHQLKCVARHGECQREWLDVLFLSRFNQLGLLSISGWCALDLYECLKILELRSLKSYGVWLVMDKRANPFVDRESGLSVPFVGSFYWASRWDCMNAERVSQDLKIKPWEVLSE